MLGYAFEVTLGAQFSSPPLGTHTLSLSRPLRRRRASFAPNNMAMTTTSWVAKFSLPSCRNCSISNSCPGNGKYMAAEEYQNSRPVSVASHIHPF